MATSNPTSPALTTLYMKAEDRAGLCAGAAGSPVAVHPLARCATRRRGHRIENTFGPLKDWCRVGTRYDRCAHTGHSNEDRRMKVTNVEPRPVLVRLEEPIGSALGTIDSVGCILVSVRTEEGVTGENLIFTLNNRRTRVLRQMVDELAELVIGRDAGHIAE